MAEAHAARIAEQFDSAAQQHAAATLGMWAFLATEVLFFGVLFASYAAMRLRFPEAFAAASAHTDKVWGVSESAVLLLSSATMAWAVRAARLGARGAVTGLLLATMALGAIFFAIHAHEYSLDLEEGLVPGFGFSYEGPLAGGVEVFYFLYYIATLLHLTHLTIGVAVIGVMAWMNHRGRFDRAYCTPLEVTGLYWHFVDIVWIFIYPLFYLVAQP